MSGSDNAHSTTPGEERDHVPELSSFADAHMSNVQRSPTLLRKSPKVPHSYAPGNRSNVSLDFFDPEGVNRLGRTLSRMSVEGAPEQGAGARSVASGETADTAVGDEKFDLEKVLRNSLKEYVLCVCLGLRPGIS